MSLQKGFFMTEPFNPDPFWDNTIVNLSGAAKFEEDTVFPAGRYSVDVQAGGGYTDNYASIGKAARITQNVSINVPFIIRAYSGSKGTSVAGGSNLYTGAFKVNAYMSASNVPFVNHIFGNSGSGSSFGTISLYDVPSGNCLGDGGYHNPDHNNWRSTGAGSCLHLLPVGGTFGTDYLFAFHCTAGGSGRAGSGSAYGGAGSGAASRIKFIQSYVNSSSYNAGSTPYGVGGNGVPAPSSQGYISGNNGTGIGYGMGGTWGANGEPAGGNGAGAWFDGTSWHDSRATADTTTADGHIIVKYVGTIN